jgi:hypothetical protein
MPEQARQDPELVADNDAAISTAFWWSVAIFACVATVVGLGYWLLTRPAADETLSTETAVTGPVITVTDAAVVAPSIPFRNITESAGIDFLQENGAYGDRLLPETGGSGAAFLDYDNDGDPDILLVNGTFWPERKSPDTVEPTMALYQNDGSGHFTDVTADVGLKHAMYGVGVAVGDYDGNGWVDVFISAVGKNRLFRNELGRFTESTEQSGVGGADDAWSTAAAFFDYDRDGDLDLFVGNYVTWSRQLDIEVDFRLTGIGRAYGPPTNFAGTHSYLYRNDGGGRFTDVSAEAGIEVANPATGMPMGKVLGVMPIDIDADNYLDIVVANDTVQNFLFQNQQDGTFSEIGMLSGLAFDSDGNATGAMGLDAAYFRGSDDLAIAIGNFANEMTSLYISRSGEADFVDEAIIEGIGPDSRLALTFGIFFFDADLDGRLDLLQVNGHIENEINRVQTSQHYEQPSQLFWNCGSGCGAIFQPIDIGAIGDLATPLVGRGATYADIDADGDLDVLITQPGRPAQLFRNDQETGNNWLRVRLRGRLPNINAIGATLEIVSGSTLQRRIVMPAHSYLSQREYPVTFGLGKARSVESLRVAWPDGTETVLEDLNVNQEIVVTVEADSRPAAE